MITDGLRSLRTWKDVDRDVEAESCHRVAVMRSAEIVEVYQFSQCPEGGLRQDS